MAKAQILYDHEYCDMPTEARQNATQPAAPPALVTRNPTASFTCSTLECSVRRPLDLSYYSALLASTIIAPRYAERGP
jgi:hypothetical protein